MIQSSKTKCLTQVVFQCVLSVIFLCLFQLLPMQSKPQIFAMSKVLKIRTMKVIKQAGNFLSCAYAAALCALADYSCDIKSQQSFRYHKLQLFLSVYRCQLKFAKYEQKMARFRKATASELSLVEREPVLLKFVADKYQTTEMCVYS